MAETMIWSSVLVGVWTATLTAVTGIELVVAAVVSVPVAVLAAVGRRVLDPSLRPRWSWSLWALRLPRAVLGDTVELTVAMVRSARSGQPLGARRSLPMPDEAADVSRARAAVAAILISATPGAYVVEVRDGSLDLHALSSRPTSLERAVVR